MQSFRLMARQVTLTHFMIVRFYQGLPNSYLKSIFNVRWCNSMARGKKTAPEDVYKIMALWFTNYNLRETARELDLPLSTVKDIVHKYKNADDFAELRTQTEKAFAQKTTEIIEKGLLLLNKRLNRAIEHEEDLDDLIDEIWDVDEDEMSYKEKDKLINKIKTLQLQNIKDITTAIGTLYDKRALSRGEMTQNHGFATNFDIDKLMDIAGYTKKDDEQK